MDRLTMAYGSRYLDWDLGAGHPTDPVRAANLMALMEAAAIEHDVIAPRAATREELLAVHDETYVDRVHMGLSDEWEGTRVDLGDVARIMAGGTMSLVDGVLDGSIRRGFNPQGAKHHAHRDHSSGFCVFNDMAMAAHRFVVAGMRVAYIDWDVHHGDGVEAICRSMPWVATASIHGNGFPGTGRSHEPSRQVWNYMLGGADDNIWINRIDRALDRLAAHKPDVLLVATGADSHRSDPLGNLSVTVDGYGRAGALARDFAETHCEGRVIVGGAGGYQPDFWTPLCWLAVARAVR